MGIKKKNKHPIYPTILALLFDLEVTRGYDSLKKSTENFLELSYC